MSDFVHLHVHSHYSLLDGGIPIEKLVERARGLGMTALGLTDHGNLFGAVEFYLECQKAGIKPILGYEAYMAPKSRLEKSAPGGISDAAYHLTLLAKNLEGYRNLMKLATAAYCEGYYYRPRIDKEILSRHSRGLIGLSGCLSSESSECLQEERISDARQVLDQFRSLFEPGHFFLEIQENGVPEQNVVNGHLVRLASETGMSLVATNDIHYLHREDFEAHDALLCIGTGKLKRDEQRLRFERNEFYFKTPEEMAEAFRPTPQALENTRLIAEMVDLKLDLKNYHHPVFRCPPGITPGVHLREVALQGLRKRYATVTPEILQRFDYEVQVIEQMGFSSYLLIVWDIMRHAREHGIPVGPGRGSAVGSLVCYALEITNLDPFKYDLIFERFINPGRNEMPDIDLDFCQARRGEMIRYVTEKYGRDCVSQIITFSTMLAKGSLRDVGRVLDVPLAEVDRLAKKVPEKLDVKLDDALKDPDFVHLVESNAVYKNLVSLAQRIEGLVRNPGVHPAGVVIADRSVSDYCPLYQPPGTTDITTQYDMKMVEKIGLLKIDFLGLATLTLLRLAVESILKRHGVRVDLDALPLDDSKTYALLGRGEAKGVFQFESDGMRQLLVSARPSCLEDLIALNAMFRPGPMQNIPAFIDRKHGRAPTNYLHPKLEPILHNTYGIIVYQEQVIRIANQIAGFSLSEADSLRKAMGKKIQALMDSYRGRFIEGAQKNEFTESQAVALWDQLVEFAKYGFNKSHAAAYAFLAYQTAYLKAHYPAEFMAALLTIETGEQKKKVSEYIQECRRMGIAVLPPDINASDLAFTPVDEGIRFGLGAVKGVGEKAVEAILRARQKEGRFRSLFDFCERVDLRSINRQTVEALIQCGAFDSLGARRSQLLLVLEEALQTAATAQADRTSGQLSLFGGGLGSATGTGERPLPDVPELDKLQLLALEREMIGFYVTGHPLEAYRTIVDTFATATTQNLSSLAEGTEAALIGIITGLRSRMGRNGKIVLIQFEDMEGSREISIFSDAAGAAGEALASGKIVLLRGQIQTYREQPDLRVREVIPLEQVCEKLARRVTLRLGGNGKIEQQIHRLKKILRTYHGSCQVFLEILLENQSLAILEAGHRLSVTPSAPFCKEVTDLLGPDSMRFTSKLRAG
ncbi:MAG: DNA polymerase III subunit alpha [Planctomycetes bacterium]|nr:DNA polymerase III subunit alpha [Planctomycetota bacterium]